MHESILSCFMPHSDRLASSSTTITVKLAFHHRMPMQRCNSQIAIFAIDSVHACHLFSQARTQISYRPITPYSVDSLLFTSRRGRHFDLSPLAVVVVVVVNGRYSAAPYSSPDRECITEVKIKHRQSTQKKSEF